MREWTSAIFWVVTGGVIAFGGLALMSIGLPFLVVGLVMAVFGMFSLKFKGVWGITIGLGAVPAYVLLRQAWEAKVSSGPPCTQEGEVTLGAPSGPGESDVVSSCSPPVPEGIVLVLVLFGAIMVSGPALRLFLLWRARSRPR